MVKLMWSEWGSEHWYVIYMSIAVYAGLIFTSKLQPSARCNNCNRLAETASKKKKKSIVSDGG